MSSLHPAENRRILIIDDNPTIHEDLRKILCPATIHLGTRELAADEDALFGGHTPTPNEAVPSGFDVDSAFQGQEGLLLVEKAAASGLPYALAFVDVRMPPGWDGIETTAKLWEVSPDLQVVICTAYSDYSWDEMIAKLGQSDRLVILKKPFENIEVWQLANALSHKWRQLQQTRIKVAGLEQTVADCTAQLRRNEEQMHLIAENAGDLIAFIDGHGRRLYCSPSHERVLGRPPDELLKSSAFAQIHPEDLDETLERTQICAESGLPQSLRYRLQHRDGSWRLLEAKLTSMGDVTANCNHLMIVAREVTERL